MVQLSYPYMTTGKTIALTIQIFVSKTVSLLFNKLSSFVTEFLPRNKYLLTSWLQSLSAVIFQAKKIKFVTTSSFSSPISYEVIVPDALILVLWMLNLSQVFNSALSLSSKDSLVLLDFCHKGGVICISKVIDISPRNLDSNLCFI